MKYHTCNIIPTRLLKKLMEQGEEKELKGHLFNSIRHSERFRARRDILGSLPALFPTGGSGKQRYVFDAHNDTDISKSTLLRKEGDSEDDNQVAKEVYDGLGYTYDFYYNNYGRKSIDNKDMPLNGYIHWDINLDNAFWDGMEMCFGDGDKVNLKGFTSVVDIIGHELTHGVTQYEAALEYFCDEQHQPGALNESISDCFGSMVKQYVLQQTADKADWLIGQGIFVKDPNWAIRSMKQPGSANPHDDQPSNMDGYNPLPNDEDDDEGGVHLFSGIPNNAFYRAAVEIGGNVWEKTGLVWYKTLSSGLPTDCSFEIFASHTIQVAGNLFGQESKEQNAIRKAWEAVKVPVKDLTAANYIPAKRK
jgi:Zn-dependent metalloprotease